MPDKKPWEIAAEAEAQTEDKKPWELAAEAESISPKPNEPSLQGAGSGSSASAPQSGSSLSTSSSGGSSSELGSWTTEANPLKKPIEVKAPLGKAPIQEAPKDIKLFDDKGRTIRKEPTKTKIGTYAFDLEEVKRNVAENPIAKVPLTQDQAFKEVSNLEKRGAAVDSLTKGQSVIFEKNQKELDDLGGKLQEAEKQIEELSKSGNQEGAMQLYEANKPLIEQYNTKLRDTKKQALKLQYLDNRKKDIDADMVNISEGQQYTTNQWSALNAGLNSLTAGLLRATPFVYNSMIALQNKIAKETGIPIAASPQTDGYLQQAAQYFQDNADAYNKVIEKKKSQTNYDIQSLLEKGEYNKAWNLLSESVFESAPTTGAIALGGLGGMTALQTTLGGGAVFGSQTFEENKKKGIDDNVNYINSWVNGILEGLFEATGTLQIVKHGADLFKKEGVKTAEETAKNIWEKVYGKVAKKVFPATAAVGEGISDGETAFTQNYVNMVSGVDQEYQTKYNEIANSDMAEGEKEDALSMLTKKHLFKGVPDAFYVGSAMGGGMGLMQSKQGYTAINDARKKEILKAKETLDKLNKTLTNPLVSNEAKDVIQAKADEEAAKIAKIADQDDADLKARLSKDEYEAVTDLQSKIETLENSLSSIDDSESKSIVEQQIKDLETEKRSVLNNAFDNIALRLQEKRKELGIEVDPLEDLPENVVNTFERVDAGLPTDINAVKEASDYLYKKYKELQAMKSSNARVLTIPQIDSYMEQLDKDITTLENYKNSEFEQSENTIPKKVLKEFTSQTEEKYGYVNRGDGKGDITLTKEEYLKEENGGVDIQQQVGEGEGNVGTVGDVAAIEKRIEEINYLLASDAASMQETGSGNLIKEGKEELRKELEDLNNQLAESKKKKVEITEKDLVQPTIKVETPNIEIAVPENPYNKSLRKLGYEDAEIDNMSMEQKQDIVSKGTEASRAESSSKVDVVKENKKQEKIAEMQKELDKEDVLNPQHQKSEPVSDVEETTPKDKVWSKVKIFNRLSKTDKKGTIGSKLRSEIMSEAAALKYTLKPTEQGKYILVDEKGKQIKNIGTPRSKDVIQEEKRLKERRSRARRELPISVKHSIAQDIANGVQFDREELMSVSGLRENEIPFWMTRTDGKGESLEFYNRKYQEKGGSYVEDDMTFQSEVADAIKEFAHKQGKTSALEYIEKKQEILENGGLTDAEIKEQAEQYQAELDEANFDYFAEYLSELSDEEAQELADQLREAEKQENELIINEILNENGKQDNTSTEQGKQAVNTKTSNTKSKSAEVEKLEREIDDIDKQISKKQSQLNKLTKDQQADMFGGAKVEMFDNGELLKELTNDIKDLRQKRNEKAAELERQLEKEGQVVQPENQLKIEESPDPKKPKKELAKERAINEPRNSVDVAKIFRKLFNFSPEESVMAARLFDAKATFMAKAKGISKEDYYKEYWFKDTGEGSKDRKGAWSKEASKAKRLISMYEKADSSTVAHEILGHDFLDRIIEASSTNKEFEEDLNTIVDEYIKANPTEKATKKQLLEDLKNFNVETFDTNNKADMRGKSVHEWFAKSAEAYMANEKGAKADSKLAKLFEKFRRYLGQIYNTATSQLVMPSKPMQEIFRKVFGAENFEAMNDIAKIEINEAQADTAKFSKVKLSEADKKRIEDLRNERGLGQDSEVDFEELYKAALYYKEMDYARIESIVDELKLLYPQATDLIDTYADQLRSVYLKKGEAFSKTGQSVAESEVIDEDTKKIISDKNGYVYDIEKLKTLANNATALIDAMGIDNALNDISKLQKDLEPKDFIAVLAELNKRVNKVIVELKKQGKDKAAKVLIEQQVDISESIINAGIEAGRTLNAMKLFSLMGVDGKLTFLKRKFDKLNGETKAKLDATIKELRKNLAKAYEDAEYLFGESSAYEELAGRLAEDIKAKDEQIADLEKRKKSYSEKESNPQGKANKARKEAIKVSEADLKAALANLKKGGLGQDISELNDESKVAMYIVQKKPIGLVAFAKEWNKLTGQKQDVSSLRGLYENIREFATKDGVYEKEYFDTDAVLDEAEQNYLDNKVKLEQELAKAQLEKELLKAKADAFKKQMSDKDKEVKAKAELKKREKEITQEFLDGLSQEGLWDKYVKANVGRVVSNLVSKLGNKPTDKALLDKLTQLATNELNRAIDELMPKINSKGTTPNYAQQLGDLISNEDKLGQIFDEAVKKFAEENQNNVAAQGMLSKLLGLKNPFSDGLLGKALEAEAEKIDTEIKDYAFQYAGARNIAKRQFVGKVLQDSELQGAEFDRLKQDLKDKFDRIIAETEKDVAGQLANAVINDTKRTLFPNSKTKDYVTELLGYLKNKAKDTYENKTQKKLTDPFEQMKYAMEMLNDVNGRKIWEESQKQIADKIDADKNLSQTEKDALKDYLKDYENTLFDQLLSENKLFNNIKKELIEQGWFVKGEVKTDPNTGKVTDTRKVDWKNLIVSKEGNVVQVKEALAKRLEGKLQGYDQAQIDKMIDAIGREYDKRIAEKKVEIADAQLNKITNPPKKVKRTIAKGKIQNLIEMENSGALNRQGLEKTIGDWLGVKTMTPQKWNRLREMIVAIEEAPEGSERDREIDKMSAYVKLNSLGRFAEIYTSLAYASMLGRPITLLKNATGIFEPLLVMAYKSVTDRRYAKAMRAYAIRGDFRDVLQGGVVQGSKLDVEVDDNGLPHSNTLSGLRREGGKIKKFFAVPEFALRGLSAMDALSQAMVAGGEDYRQLVSQKIKEGMSEADAKRQAIEEMTSDNSYASSLAEADKEFKNRGITPTNARLKRRAYEIMRESYTTSAMRDLSTQAALEEAFKSKLPSKGAKRDEVNKGVFTYLGAGFGAAVKGVADKIGEYAGSVSETFGASEARQKKVSETTSQLMQMTVLPFVRGASNVVESGLEKTPYGMFKGAIQYYKENKNYKNPTTPEEELIHEYMLERAKKKAGKAAATMILGGAFYYTLMAISKSGDDDDENKDRIPTGFYPAGDIKWQGRNNIKKHTIPTASLVIFGKVIPLSFLGTIGIGALFVANNIDLYNKYQDRKADKPKDPDSMLTGDAAGLGAAIIASTSATVLNMSMYKGTSEVLEAMNPESYKSGADYLENEIIKSLTNPIPLKGTLQQTLQIGRGIFGDAKAQASIGFDERLYKEFGLAGIAYDRPVVDYRGREIGMAQANAEGAGGVDAALNGWKLDDTDKYLMSIGFNPVIDKRSDIVDNDNFSMSRADHYDYSVKVSKMFGEFLDSNIDYIKKDMTSQEYKDYLVANGKDVEKELTKEKKKMVSQAHSDFENLVKLEYKLNKGIISPKEYTYEVYKTNNDIKGIEKRIQGVE